MGRKLVRFERTGDIGWGLLEGQAIRVLDTDAKTLGEVLQQDAAGLSLSGTEVALDSARLLSPVTVDGDYICQATNFKSHVREIHRDPDKMVNNVFFQKASSCLCGPTDDIIKPKHVQLLDYEVEMALVIKAPIAGPINATEDTLGNWVAGYVLTNDVTARDVQISHEQFHKSKSYRTFGPTGPHVWLAEPADFRRWRELRMTLSVNGEERQNDFASDMIFDPVQTLNELSRVRDMKPGDIIATGTPSGVALKVPSKFVLFLGNMMSPAKRFRLFLKSQLKSDRYLQPGHVVECQIRTDDGEIDLGTQQNEVRAE